MSDRVRLILLVVVVVLGLGVAAVPLVLSVVGDDDPQSTTAPSTAAGTDSALPGAPATARPDGSDGPVDAAGTRYKIADAVRSDCPTGGVAGVQGSAAADPGPAGSELARVTLPCLTDGGDGTYASMAQALAGKPTLVNIWAWWCGPCRDELPVLQKAAEKHPEWNIVGVHADGQGQAGADMLAELGVRFASFQDSTGAFAAATGIPSVIPVSVIYRADGSRAAFHPGEITSVEQLEEIMADAG